MEVLGMSSIASVTGDDGTHPFFQNFAGPGRPVTPDQGDLVDDEVESPSDGEEVSPVKGSDMEPQIQVPRSGPLTERPSNIYLPPVTSKGISDLTTSSSQLTEEPITVAPPQKVLKVNSNGKLLSSPPPVSGSPSKTKAMPTKSPRKTRAANKKAGVKAPHPKRSLIVKIQYGLANADRRSELGQKIDQVLKAPRIRAPLKKPTPVRTPPKSTHPFFLAKAKQIEKKAGAKDDSGDDDLECTGTSTTRVPHRPSPKKGKAWSDIVFSTAKKDRSSLETAALWPPAYAVRVDDLELPKAADVRCSVAVKLKSKGLSVPLEEDLLARASIQYRRDVGVLERQNEMSLRLPLKRVLTGSDLTAELAERLTDSVQPVTQTLQNSLPSNLSAFDQGRCEQSSWATKNAPIAAVDVMQAGPEAVILRDWVRQLTVNSVGEGLESRSKESKPAKKKKRKSSEMDDFLVRSDDEDNELSEIYPPAPEDPFTTPVTQTLLRPGKSNAAGQNIPPGNVMLLSGPSGCGKTASVYAIAKELGFEVFELNPGSRRNHRDIFDKVGDMTQNHLVSHGAEHSAAEDTLVEADESDVQRDIASGKQGTMQGFFKIQPKTQLKAEQKRKAEVQDDQRDVAVKKPKRAQKQSLILLEEVDILFDDDKTFWSGVHSLIEQSKRPIILTCNDESALPLDGLPLHGILRYSPPSEHVAVDHLLTLAAHEGHQLDRGAVTHLHRSRNQDLRASLTEVNFWCQMGVGSRKGGLDWMLDRRNTPDALLQRVISTDTYLAGMNLVPHDPDPDPEQLMLHAHTDLDIPIDTWCYDDTLPFSPLMNLADTTALTTSQSDLDLCRPRAHHATDPTNLQLRIATALTTRMISTPPTASTILNTKTIPNAHPGPKPLFTPPTLAKILAPLALEKPIFPPSIGRLAPTLDAPMHTLTTEVAPYVRAIVAHDRRWGGLANAAAMQKRETRACRKGGGWFSAKLDRDAVLRTSGEGWDRLLERTEAGTGEEGVEMVGVEEAGDESDATEIGEI